MSDYRDRLDDIEHFVERTEGKVYPRRIFLGMCAVLGLAPIGAGLKPAMADQSELVLVNWGGDAIRGMKNAWVDPYLKKYPDRKVAIDGTGPSTSRIRLMVQSGKVTWDVMDRNLHTALELGPEGMLEKMDYSIIDKSKVRPEHAVEWGIGNYIYAMVLTLQHQEVGRRGADQLEGCLGLQEVPRQARLPARARWRAGGRADGRRRAVR